MSGKTTITYHYTPSQLRGLLSKFQDAIDRKQYSEKIPYDTWRKMMRIAGDVQIDYVNPFVKIFNPKDNNVIYSAKVYNNGFGRFFYDEVIKKEWNKDMTLNSANSVTFTCDNADLNSGLWSKLTGVPVSVDADTASTAYATPLENKVDYVGYFDSDSTTGCPNYGTTTNHTIKINGEPLSGNSIYIQDNYNGIWETARTVTNISTIDNRVETLESQVEQLMNEKKKENDKMKGFNFDFGPCTDNSIRMSMYGMAVKNAAGVWVSYDKSSDQIVDVDILNFDGGKYFYKFPVALSAVGVGDVIVHNRKPMFVTGTVEGRLVCIDVVAGEEKTVVPTMNMFGFNFVTKVISLFDNFVGGADTANPFGNMLPFLMLSGDNKDLDPMMLMCMMGQNGGNMTFNPMMLYFMSQAKGDIDPMVLMCLMGNNPFGVGSNTCKCGCHSDEAEKEKVITPAE